MVKDHVSDFVIALKNAGSAGKKSVSYPYTKLLAAIAEVLQKEGYVVSVDRRGRQARKFLEVSLAYDAEKRPKISGVSRVSKPSRRVYGKAKHLYPVLNGLGRIVLSTPRGVMTDVDARKQRVGGELLFKIW